MKNKVLKHIGCGNSEMEGFENTDRETFDLLSQTEWDKIPDNSVDAYVAHHVLQEFPWRNLIALIREIHRTLKPGGVFRLGVPYLGSGMTIQFLLSWGNINLFSLDLLKRVFEEEGFEVRISEYGETSSEIEGITTGDNRPEETLFLEVFKK